ncbi:hypothetical protein E8E11_010310 [Didymella keratinophila]|nr:hypothetical protein E8E11_010310 [Didymella keratinophila]
MRKSIELGRAVLSTTTANSELWLTTLITISPQQQCTNLEQRDAASILSHLSSGDVWVGRGQGLYIDLDITLKGQPLAEDQLQQLSEALLEAPVWAQLHLQPSMPCGTAPEPGKLRIMISHSDQTATLAAKPRHRVLSNIPAADLRPPEGVPVFSLDSVGLSMDVFEIIPKRTTSTAKRLKTSTTSNHQSQSQDNQDIDDVDHEATDTLLLGVDPTSPSHLTSTLKRLRPLTSPAERTTASQTTHSSGALSGPRSNSQGCETQDTQLCSTSVEPTSMRILIDGALRLSVLSSITSKMLPGIKIKANTFGPGLADLAPTLWKPGYLLSLSQRASLLPTISRSLCQPEATARATSISLKQKLSALATQLPLHRPPIHMQGQKPAMVLDKNRLLSPIAPRLWLQLQKYVPCKQAIPLQSFFATWVKSTPLSDDILQEAWKEPGHNRRARPDPVGPDGGGASNVDQSLEGGPAAMAACDGLSSERHLLGAVVTPEFTLEADDDELLLGAECFEDANLLAFRGANLS